MKIRALSADEQYSDLKELTQLLQSFDLLLEEVQRKASKLKGLLSEQKGDPLFTYEEDGLITPPLKPLEVIPVEQKDKLLILQQNDIIFIYTEKDNVYLKTQKDSYLTRFTLRELELRLSSTPFFRCHRCYLVNLQHMRVLIPFINGTYSIVVDDNEHSQIPVSRTKARLLKGMLGL